MIFVSVGTQPQPFTRLIKAVDELVNEGVIHQDVVIQSGSYDYTPASKKILARPYFNQKEIADMMERADAIICHGGVGTILSALKMGKKIISMPRLKMYGEHMNDHQYQILKKLSSDGNIMFVNSKGELQNALIKLDSFIPKVFDSNPTKAISTIKYYIINCFNE